MAGFWSDPNTEPKRAYRFLLNIGGIPQWIVKSTGKPSYSVSETEVPYINHKFWYPGRIDWEPVTVVLMDPVAPDASKTIVDILTASGYHFPEDPNDTSTISKASAVAALGQVVISQIAPDGKTTVEEWTLINAWIQAAKFGDLSYDSEDMTELEITIRYDYAKIVKSGQGTKPANQ